MKHLSECPTHGSRQNRIVEEESDQTIELTGDLPLVIYQIDSDNCFWPGDRRPDAVLVADLEGRTRSVHSLVGFIEMKSRLRGKERKSARQQLEMGVSHFHPYGRLEGMHSHGDAHHDRWSKGEDVLPIMPDEDHAVFAISVGFREGSRFPLSRKGKVVFSSIILSQRTRGQVTIEGYEFLKRAGVLIALAR